MHIKRLIKRNVAIFTSKSEELIMKRASYVEQREAHGPVMSDYVQRRNEYETRDRDANDVRM